jgi:Cyclin-dependent kinase regulatory subunit
MRHTDTSTASAISTADAAGKRRPGSKLESSRTPSNRFRQDGQNCCPNCMLNFIFTCTCTFNTWTRIIFDANRRRWSRGIVGLSLKKARACVSGSSSGYADRWLGSLLRFINFAFGVCALSSERISFPTAFFRLVSCQGACVLPFNVLIMSSSRIEYSEKYADDNYEYRYDIVPPMFLRKARITIPCRAPELLAHEVARYRFVQSCHSTQRLSQDSSQESTAYRDRGTYALGYGMQYRSLWRLSDSVPRCDLVEGYWRSAISRMDALCHS